jgi:hypothetical protein
MNKPILCLDFDGVLHSYTSGWKGARNIPDPPVPGAMQFLWDATEHFTVAILSSRSNHWFGRSAMRWWLEQHFYRVFDHDTVSDDKLSSILWPLHKPSAFVTIDDRALTFDGTWPTIDTIKKFKPWNKRPKPQALSGSLIGGVVSGEGLQPAGRELNALELGAEARRQGIDGFL